MNYETDILVYASLDSLNVPEFMTDEFFKKSHDNYKTLGYDLEKIT